MHTLNFDIRIAGIVENSIVDGPGIRYSIFTQGCPHNCPDCHNPQTHDPEGGKLISAQRILNAIHKDPLLKGVTFSGGEPFLQAEALSVLAEEINALGKDIVTYTGYTFEQLLQSQTDEYIKLLRQTKLLIDGPFLVQHKDLSLPFRGSSNQRIIDCAKSLALGKIVEFMD